MSLRDEGFWSKSNRLHRCKETKSDGQLVALRAMCQVASESVPLVNQICQPVAVSGYARHSRIPEVPGANLTQA